MVDFKGNTNMNCSHKIFGLVTQAESHDWLIPWVHHQAVFDQEIPRIVLQHSRNIKTTDVLTTTEKNHTFYSNLGTCSLSMLYLKWAIWRITKTNKHFREFYAPRMPKGQEERQRVFLLECCQPVIYTNPSQSDYKATISTLLDRTLCTQGETQTRGKQA